MKKLYFIVISILLISLLTASACTQQTQQPASSASPTSTVKPTSSLPPASLPAVANSPIIIKCMSLTRHTLPLDSWNCYEFIINKINKAANGALIMKDVGGPDAIPAESQPQAVQSGVVDFIHSGTGFCDKIVPQLDLFEISPLITKEEMSSGFVDFLNEYCEKQGMFLLGRNPNDVNNEAFVLRKESKAPSDLKGLRCAGLNAGDKTAAQALGMDYINIDRADRYTSMERGLVSAIAISPGAAGFIKLHEVAKYYVSHLFYRKDSLFMFNYQKFSSLPAYLQKLIVDTYVESIPEAVQLYINIDAVNEKIFTDGGAKPITYSPDDAKTFSDAIWIADSNRVLGAFPSLTDRVHKIWGK